MGNIMTQTLNVIIAFSEQHYINEVKVFQKDLRQMHHDASRVGRGWRWRAMCTVASAKTSRSLTVNIVINFMKQIGALTKASKHFVTGSVN